MESRSFAVALAAVLHVAACLPPPTFECGSDSQCGAEGVCEATATGSYCSEVDLDCTSGRRFVQLAGEYGSRCVGDEIHGGDAGTERPDASGEGQPDASGTGQPDASGADQPDGGADQPDGGGTIIPASGFIATGIQGRNGIYALVDGSLTEVFTLSANDQTQAVALGDCDGDGDLDLAVANDGKNIVYRNDRTEMTVAWESVATDDTFGIALHDYDGDGILDLTTASSYTGDMLKGDGNCGFTYQHQVTTAMVARVVWTDVDGDGVDDLILSTWQHPVWVYLNGPGLRNPPSTPIDASWSTPTNYEGRGLAVADYDKDGVVEVAVAQDGIVDIYDPFTSAPPVQLTVASASSLAFGDYDGDGDLDLAVGAGGRYSSGAAANVVFRNDDGVFVKAWTSTEIEPTNVIQWFDIDQDGDLDLIAANDGIAPSRIYRNDSGTLVPTWTFPVAVMRGVMAQ